MTPDNDIIIIINIQKDLTNSLETIKICKFFSSKQNQVMKFCMSFTIVSVITINFVCN